MCPATCRARTKVLSLSGLINSLLQLKSRKPGHVAILRSQWETWTLARSANHSHITDTLLQNTSNTQVRLRIFSQSFSPFPGQSGGWAWIPAPLLSANQRAGPKNPSNRETGGPPRSFVWCWVYDEEYYCEEQALSLTTIALNRVECCIVLTSQEREDSSDGQRSHCSLLTADFTR